MTEFRFTNEHRASEVGNVAAVLGRPRLWIPTGLDYPDHPQWLERAEDQIQTGKKRVMLAYRGVEPIGAVVYQRHEARPTVVEVRNISISPDSRGRYIGSFLLRTTELEAVRHDFPDTASVMVDTKLTNKGMITFLEANGYALESITDLYGTGVDDAVFLKPIVA